jgi:hypothetical protein
LAHLQLGELLLQLGQLGAKAVDFLLALGKRRLKRRVVVGLERVERLEAERTLLRLNVTLLCRDRRL